MSRYCVQLVALTLTLSVTAIAHGQQVDIQPIQFGMGNAFRPGDLTGLELKLTSGLEEPSTIEVVWELPNADGDIAEISRELVLQPGAASSVWLYGRILPDRTADNFAITTFITRAYLLDDGQRQQEIGQTRFSPANLNPKPMGVDLNQDLIGIFGTNEMGLARLRIIPNKSVFIPSMNSVTFSAMNLQPRQMPDRWEGLDSYNCIIWTGSTHTPADLGRARSRALIEWVRRGGNLVICLPVAADPWQFGTTGIHDLEAFLPATSPTRHDGVYFHEIMPIISTSNVVMNPEATTSIHTFATEQEQDYEPFMCLTSPRSQRTGVIEPRTGTLDGQVIAIRRRLGYGHITICGLDLPAINARRQQGLTQLPIVDVFWNRLLGRRADSPSAETYKVLSEQVPPAQRLIANSGIMIDLAGGRLISEQIGMGGQAAIGILGAFIIFIVYWLIAGPGGYAILKKLGLVRHAWLAFVVAAISFTIIAWAAGMLINKGKTRIQHISFVDHMVQGPSTTPDQLGSRQRVKSWFTTFLPGYGRSMLALGGEGAGENVLSSFSSPPGFGANRFPNTDRYIVDVDEPSRYEIPTRSTASEFTADWLGGVPTAWGSISLEGALEISQHVRTGGEPELGLHGRLKHSLPGSLQGVLVIHISPFRSPLMTLTGESIPLPLSDEMGQMPNIGRFARLATWEPGQPLDLSTVLYPDGRVDPRDLTSNTLARSIRDLYSQSFNTNRDSQFDPTEQMLDSSQSRTFMDMLSMYMQLQPPAYTEDKNQNIEPVRVSRIIGRQLDLSNQFTSPCLLIIGYLQDSECPIPIEVNDSKPESTGLTVVRWICPLPEVPSLVVPEPRAASTATASALP